MKLLYVLCLFSVALFCQAECYQDCPVSNCTWRQTCADNYDLTCGTCQGCSDYQSRNCLYSEWEPIYDQPSSPQCGMEPRPYAGCTVSGCINGHWRQICDYEY